MKQLLIIFIFMFSFATSMAKDQSPVQWSVSLEKIHKNIYKVIVNAVIEPGWYVYASDVQSTSLEAIKISFETKKIHCNKLQYLFPPETIYDQVYLKKQKVFKGIISFVQEIEVGEPLQTADINIHAVASNQEQTFAIDTTITLSFDLHAKASLIDNNLNLTNVIITKLTGFSK